MTVAPGDALPDPTDNATCCASTVPDAVTISNCAVINNLVNNLDGELFGNMAFITPLVRHIDLLGDLVILGLLLRKYYLRPYSGTSVGYSTGLCGIRRVAHERNPVGTGCIMGLPWQIELHPLRH